MSRYGVDLYGQNYYGSGTLTLVDFDASPFTAVPSNYGEITLRWVIPSGDWSNIRLVRSRYGFPLTADDGDIILETADDNAPNYYIDDGEFPANVGLIQGIDYFYSLFVLKVVDGFWAKAGDAVTISAKEYDAPSTFYTSLPQVYQTKSHKVLTSASDNSDFDSFLSIFETYYDFMKTYSELVLKMYDATVIHYPALEYMLKQFGGKFEPELGVQQSRIFLRNIMLLNKNKGSLQGLKDFIKAFTGWDTIVTPTVNLMLSYDDSSFEESVGNWESISNANLSTVAYGTLTPYGESTLPAAYPNKQNASLKLKAVGNGDVEIACGLSAPLTKGIPVQSGFTYTFSVYTQAGATARDVVLDIRWYDRFGVEMSRAGETTLKNAVGNWSKRAWTTGPAPENSYFAVPYIRVKGCSTNELHYFDAAQFEISNVGPTGFEEARGVNIQLLANRVNLISNPCFESVLTPWTATNATITRVDDEFVGEITNSVHALHVAPSSNGAVKVTYDDFIKIEANEWYSLSGYIRTAYTGLYENDRVGGYTFDWYDQTQNYISTTGLTTEVLTEYYETASIYRTNNVLTVQSNELTSLIPGDDIRLVGFDGTEDLSGIDGTYEIIAVNGTEIQVTSSGDNIPLINRSQSYTSAQWLIQDLKLDFIQKGSSSLSPTNAYYVKPSFNWTNAEVGQELWIDSHLLEKSTSIKSFFDGSSGVSEPTDLLWEGATNVSVSHYYKNKEAVLNRLVRELPKYLYINQWFALYFANSYQH